MTAAGNAAGYALSGGVLKLWVDFNRVDTGTAFGFDTSVHFNQTLDLKFH